MAGPGAKPDPAATQKLRLDKWLWQARFLKSRTLAAEAVEAGRVRVNGQRVTKPGHGVAPGDALTLTIGDRVRLIRVLELGQRRGPATEAQELYLDLDPVTPDVPDALE